jgi:hypothetical protein
VFLRRCDDLPRRKDSHLLKEAAEDTPSQTTDHASASLTCLDKKSGRGAFDSKGNTPSRLQEISLFFVTLGRNSILTWSHLMIKTPIAIAAAAPVGLSFAQPALRQSNG